MLQKIQKTRSYICGKGKIYNTGFDTTMAIIYNKDVRENV